MQRAFVIPDTKPSYASWYVELDLTRWLDGETIDTVDFSAIDVSTGEDATDIVLDDDLCTDADGIVKPYITGGVSGSKYGVKILVDTAEGSSDEFWIYFTVLDER